MTMDWFQAFFLIVLPPASFVVAIIEHRKKPASFSNALLLSVSVIVAATMINLINEQINPQHNFTFRSFFLLKQATFASDFLAIGYGLAAFCFYLALFDRRKADEGRGNDDGANGPKSP